MEITSTETAQGLRPAMAKTAKPEFRPGFQVVRRSLVDQVTDGLRDAILSAAFAPGTRLTEMELAAWSGASRGTVRAALGQLEREDLVVCERYSAWSVRRIEDRDIREVYGMRATLESGAARLLAAAIDRRGIEALRAAQAALEKAEASRQARRRLEADLAFHRLIVELCGNRLLLAAYDQIANKVRWIYAAAEALSPERIDLVAWHAPLADAICAGEAERAAKIAHDMYRASLEDDLRDRREAARRAEAGER